MAPGGDVASPVSHSACARHSGQSLEENFQSNAAATGMFSKNINEFT